MAAKKENTGFDTIRFVKKVRFELGIFLTIIGAVSFALPREALVGLYSLLAAKVLTVTIGVMLAHLLRVCAFHYLSLKEIVGDNRIGGAIFLAVWYAVIIYAVAIGG